MVRRGLLVAALVLALDLATKTMVLAWLREPVALAPFANLVVVWNEGVSFGMLGDAGPLVLIGLAGVITALLVVWLSRTSELFLASALGLVIGGAVGNVIDRLRFGAVLDFLDLHVAGYHWPAFNVADSAICIGAGLLLLDGLRSPRHRPT
ncbi:signal peptidase II [Marinivivus vitaminiproducens]|uniref:signal peptidase II n=1 Tax=Marinivivus vitaminiproducens TaxID=3035935 RepID=UPI0027987E00|nr:signal peptidase II [Geminicoccaceae bacterium SCSIO 64248]